MINLLALFFSSALFAQEAIEGLADDPIFNGPASETSVELQDLEAEFNSALDIPEALTGGNNNQQADESNNPEDFFHRVPLKPRMSDLNWNKWAGPLLDKIYRIRKGDTLWAVSERLFGNPHLWPKVWQLNAFVTNAHIIEPGMEMQFRPGNPFSAPSMAFTNALNAEIELGELDVSFTPVSLLEKLEKTLLAQSMSQFPPFRTFLLSEKPKIISKLPAPSHGTRVFFEEGESFATELEDGTYSIVKWERLSNIDAYRTFWLGVLQVESERATLVKAFGEVEVGDVVTSKLFLLSPLAVHEEEMGEDERGSAQLVHIAEGFDSFAHQYMMMGVQFKSSSDGPQPGALVKLLRGKEDIVGQALLVDRNEEAGTLWLIDTVGEVRVGDRVF